ncbi:MAG: WbuC family cupin fold metalloprotein [bacterium]|nr:WbuC family cupin fold metalloprotein [bacterium]
MTGIAINRNLLETTAKKGAETPRGRTNFNFHQSADDLVQRMLNAIEPGSYVQPHRHLDPPKAEAFLCLKGRGVVIFFDDSGEAVQFFPLDPASLDYGVEVPVGTWHAILSFEPGSVYYEVKHGPYVKISDKDFAPWAPAEGDPEMAAYQKHLEKISRQALGWE